MKTDNLFLNFELLLLWEKLRDSNLLVCKSEIEGECVWWCGMKLCRRFGSVVVKDMDYGFMVQARQVTNERYLKRLIDFVLSVSNTDIYFNRAKPDFIKQNVRGICRFGDNLNAGITDEMKKKIKEELLEKSVREVAANYNLTEHYVKKLKYEKIRTV